jgi:alpha-glucosidase
MAETNPYACQDHLHDKTQPENLGFLKRFGALLKEYDNRMSVGEVGDEGRSLDTVAAYTSGGDKLSMCYTFDLLGPQFSAAHVRQCIAAFESRVADGWICWAFSNHDVMRHASRWTKAGADTDRTARFAIDLLVALRGSICIYQGEELGLEEAELAFEDLRDPYGIRFWPAFKGRDGCRTPMVWEAEKPSGGFTTGKPWLPVPASHLARAVDCQEGDPGSVLARYRDMLAFRRQHPALVHGDIRLLDDDDEAGGVLAFLRSAGDERLLCLFNFADEDAEWSVPEDLHGLRPIGASAGAVLREGRLALKGLSSFFASIP